MDDDSQPLPQRAQFRKREQTTQPELMLRGGQSSPKNIDSSSERAGFKEPQDENEEEWHPGLIRTEGVAAGNGQSNIKYEYLVVVCMFSYITDLSTVEELDPPITIEVSGHDMESLLYAFMDEFLFQFCVEGFVCRRVRIDSFDRTELKVRATGFGEKFQPRAKHPQGTEIKAITYSAMQIRDAEEGRNAEVYVIVDI